MQEKEQKISPIKQRILFFVEKLGISKRDFYAKIGVSRGTLESKTGITEDVITKFYTAYPNINIEWLMTGNGDMYLETNNFATMQEKEQKIDENNVSAELSQSANDQQLIAKLLEQAEEIGRLKERIAQLEREKGKDVSAAQTSGAANVG
ncbi:MAG: hypothetical protein IJW01_07780 [Paludibacteraceae bacterium]|nr:hypothetical protein [Paludibacteraceae bacterium]